jgi:chromosome segregation ATPase
LSELTEQNVLSRLKDLEQKMSNLDNTVDALIDELEYLQAVSRELNMPEYIDKFNKYIEEVGQIRQDLSCKLSDDIENEQMRKLVESRIKTVPADIENLKNEYQYVRGRLAEMRDEINKNKSSG